MIAESGLVLATLLCAFALDSTVKAGKDGTELWEATWAGVSMATRAAL